MSFFCFHSQAMSVCSTVQAFLGDCKRLPKREANKGRTARGKANWQLLSVLNNLSSRNQAQHVRRESVSNCIWREVSLHTRTQDCSCLCFTWDCLTISLQSQEPRPVNGSRAASPGAQSQKEKVPPCMGTETLNDLDMGMGWCVMMRPHSAGRSWARSRWKRSGICERDLDLEDWTLHGTAWRIFLQVKLCRRIQDIDI